MISDITFRVRESSSRNYNERVRRAIEIVRKFIYQDKRRIDDRSVSDWLDEWSLAPIEVVVSQ